MKNLLLFFLNIFLITALHGKIEINEGFRNSKWGANISDVESKETAVKIDSVSFKDFTLLIYRDKIIERNAVIYYGFHNNQLLFGTYTFFDDYTNNKNLYFDDYEMIKNILASQYGNPTEDKWITQNNEISMYKDNPNLAENALALGILELKSTWNLADGSIILSLNQNNGIFIRVNYLSAAFLNSYDISTVSSLGQLVK